MQHMGQEHGFQVLLAESVGQLRWLNRSVSPVALSDRNDVAGAALAGATLLSANFALGTFLRHDRRQPRHQDAAAVRQPVSNFLRARSQYLQENL